MQTYQVLNSEGFQLDETSDFHVKLSTVSLSTEDANIWIKAGALLKNVTPIPSVWDRDPDFFYLEPPLEDVARKACEAGCLYAQQNYTSLLLASSKEKLTKRSYWKSLAQNYVQNEEDDQCKLDCYEGYLRGATGYCVAMLEGVDFTKFDLYQYRSSSDHLVLLVENTEA